MTLLSLLILQNNDRLWTQLSSVSKQADIDGVYVGTLGRARSDVENVMGSLALVTASNEMKPSRNKVGCFLIAQLGPIF